MPIVYRKTAKGLAEIETRAHRLAPRLRAALIVVDGKRDDAELAKLILQQPQETMDWLREQGFIEALGAPPRQAAPAQPASPAPSATAKPAAAPAAAPAANGLARPTVPTGDFPTIRRDAVDQLYKLLGPPADQLAIRMEEAKSMAALRELLPVAIRAVTAMRGKEAAETYARRFGLL
jgi:hypothetical protein